MKFFLLFILGLVMIAGVMILAKSGGDPSKIAGSLKPTPTEAQVAQLDPADYPEVSLTFRADSKYVTVKLAKLKAAALEYNLIYDATVKKNKIQSGVNATAKLDGKTTYAKEQLLGSESSGKFTYHENIQNAIMELTLRDAGGHSIYTATYPFVVTPGKTTLLTPTN